MAGRTRTSEARPWTRWQDWAVVLLGASLFLMTPITAPGSGTRLTVLVLGSLLALSGVYSLGAPALRTEYTHIVLGIVLFVSPWMLRFADLHNHSAWVCWGLGFLAVLLGLAGMPAADTGEQETEDPLRKVSDLTDITRVGGRHHLPDPDQHMPVATGTSTLRTFSRWSGNIEE